jgi:hypothetical protein
MKRAVRPRYWKTRGAYYCWRDNKQYLLAKGDEHDPNTMKTAWEAFWRLYQTPLARRLEVIDWKETAGYFWDVLPNPLFIGTFPPEQHRTQAAWSIPAWLTDYGRATDEDVQDRLRRAGLDLEFLAYLAAAFGRDSKLRLMMNADPTTVPPAG